MVAAMGGLRRALGLALVMLLVGGSALAAPLLVRSDRSDNIFYFSYRAGPGRITGSSSSARFVRDDPVTFLFYAREAARKAKRGERLRARFGFELNERRVVRYEGTFRFEVRNGQGAVVYSDSVDRKLVLRPRPGERKKGFSLLFDLPRGTYEARAFFKT